MRNYCMRESSDKEANLIIDNIVEYNLSKVPRKRATRPLWINRVIENPDGEIIAGILSKINNWNCLYIDVLWVKEEYRKDGLGSKLLVEIERVAKEKDCHLIHLDTFDFQAKDFYLKHGYKVFGVLEDCPQGHKRYYMKKNI